MRPKSIVQFEKVVLFSIATGIVQSILQWDTAAAELRAKGFGSGLLIGTQLAGLGIYLLLLWFIARKGSFMARGIYVVLIVIGIVIGLVGLSQPRSDNDLSLGFTILQAVLSLISIWLLFRRDSNAWFNDSRMAADPETFR